MPSNILFAVSVVPQNGPFIGNHQEYWKDCNIYPYGDYWVNLSNFERKATARIILEREEQRKSEREAANKPTVERKAKKAPKAYKHKEHTYEGKLERYGEGVLSMHSQGKSIDHIRNMTGMGAVTVKRIIKDMQKAERGKGEK